MNPTIRVLYAEDNPNDADLTRNHFQMEAPGFEMELAGTGKICLERLKAETYDILLLDYRLPDMDGTDVLKTMLIEGFTLPVVMVTGSGDEELVVQALRLGASDYVPKHRDYLLTLPGILKSITDEYRRKKQAAHPLAPRLKRILYVEHNEMDIELTIRHFAETAPNIQVESVRSGREALRILTQVHDGREASPCDLVLADLRGTDMSALDLCRELKHRGIGIPMIVITGKGVEQTAVAVLKLGAYDYIVKRENYLTELPYAVESAIAHFQLDQTNRKLHAELEALNRSLDQKVKDRTAELEREICEKMQAVAERERLTAAIEQAGEAVFITDPEGTIQYVNPAFERRTGYAREEALGKNPRMLKSGKHDLAFYQDLWRTITSGRTWEGRMVNKRKDGKLYTEDATISPVSDASGRIVNYVAVKHDITEHLRMAEQLQQAQKMESVGRLAGGVAHDFNNMMNVVMGFTELIVDKLPVADPIQQDLQEVMSAAKRATEITRQLLAFARKQTINPEMLDLNEIVADMLKMLRRLIGEDIDLAWQPEAGLWLVKIDPSQIDQILANLCVNARDAIADVGKVFVETANVALDPAFCTDHLGFIPGDYVMLAVSDNGCGMDKETSERIFEPFFTTKDVGKGTGLGLATVYGIVKQNNGFINVYSEPDKGTTFKIYLPRAAAAAAETRMESAAQIEPGRGETVLVVEDEFSILNLARIILETLGYTVLTADTAGEAMSLAERHSGEVHLLITDVVMPGMNGRDLADGIRKLRPEMKCLFMSGYTANVIAHHGVLEKGIHFLQKPFSVKSLAAKVREALDNANG
jgi:PAS domain S-box-containing protein